MKKRLLLIGGGGHCHSVLDSVIASCEYDEIGIVDFTDCSVLGIPVVGKDDDLPLLKSDGWTDAFITVGSIGDTSIRRRLYELVNGLQFNIPVILDPTAIVARGTHIESGAYVGKGAIINTNARIGICSIINTKSVVEHDCMIGDFVHICPGTIVCGAVGIGDDTNIGAGSVVRQTITVGKNCLVGAGSVVVKNIPDNVKAYGNPCKVIE